jgi:ubiquinone/menaquinone biosynthesis C-methylase UbiE/acyl carrier protein
VISTPVSEQGQSEGENARIMAYYVPSLAMERADGAVEDEEAVAYWRKVYETVIYEDVGASTDDGQFETVGWTETASGAQLSAEDMSEQVAGSVARIAALGGARVLEFGCGTGLILFRLASQSERVVGIDISERALDHVRTTAAAAGLSNVELRLGGLEALAEFEDGAFDTIVLNSVVQYFPSTQYLERALAELVRVATPGAAIFLGDIRHLGLLETFHAEIELQKEEAGASSAAALGAVQRRMEEEQELILHPHYFAALRERLPRVQDVRIQLKRGRAHNELARYRYDVVLRLDRGPAAPGPAALVSARDVRTMADVLARLRERADDPVLIRDVPNARVAGAAAAAAALRRPASFPTLADVSRAAETSEGSGLDPEAIWAAAETLGLEVQIGWGADAATFDILIPGRKRSGAIDLPRKGGATDERLATDPSRGRSLRHLGAALQAHLEQRLPEYMLPFGYVRLRALPLTPNGKVDRAALARMAPPASRRKADRAPQSDTERRVAAIFREVLQVRAVGVDDDFFRVLGGHSLLATQAISRIRAEFGVALPLRTIFEAGTVQGLAAAVEAQPRDPPDGEGPLAGPARARLDHASIETMDDAELDQALAALEGEADA